MRRDPDGFDQAEVASVMRHLFEQAHITVEDRGAVEQALFNCEAGIDFADALHHASYESCDSVATFDDRLRTKGSWVRFLPAAPCDKDLG
ncbi:hypothetical protein [Aquabacterium sp.]|uniref:hypothetical protein n=1 Tax=Aquabacterium sp. TaxID=1872578 RepID=UPI002C657403|nr:hypothetical protein [Aquabacterium sp.]HSW05178.1 hypothetical protein [Aquabacterium sp.]